MSSNSWLTPNAKGYENYTKNYDICYNNIINYDGLSNPHFYNVVINSEILSEKYKIQFLDEFWKKFSNPKNKNFRKKVYGKYLFWINGEFMGDLDDANNFGSYKDDKFGIYIGENYET